MSIDPDYNYCEHCIHFDWQKEECILEREHDFEEDVCEFEPVEDEGELQARMRE